MIVIVTGPVRSGKSTRALDLARSLGGELRYVATARVDPGDAEMADRIARHRAERDGVASVELWTPGTPDLPALIGAAKPGTTLLVDSLGTWVAGHLLECEAEIERDAVAGDALLAERTSPLIAALALTEAHVVLVSEETGWGLVPPYVLGRVFRDHLGRLVQSLVPLADRVELVVAGFALDLTAAATPVRPTRVVAAPRSVGPGDETPDVAAGA